MVPDPVSSAGVSAGRGTPGIEAAAEALAAHQNKDRYVLDHPWQSTTVEPYEADASDFYELVEMAIPAFLAAEPPADVLRALLEAQPEAFRAALTEMLTSDMRAVALDLAWSRVDGRAWAGTTRTDMAEAALAAAVASLKPKEGESR